MADKKRIDELIKLNQAGAESAREQGKEPGWAKPKIKKFNKGGRVSAGPDTVGPGTTYGPRDYGK